MDEWMDGSMKEKSVCWKVWAGLGIQNRKKIEANKKKKHEFSALKRPFLFIHSDSSDSFECVFARV